MNKEVYEYISEILKLLKQKLPTEKNVRHSITLNNNDKLILNIYHDSICHEFALTTFHYEIDPENIVEDIINQL